MGTIALVTRVVVRELLVTKKAEKSSVCQVILVEDTEVYLYPDHSEKSPVEVWNAGENVVVLARTTTSAEVSSTVTEWGFLFMYTSQPHSSAPLIDVMLSAHS